MTKLILTFVAGVLVGVLGATSTLFQGEPEQPPTEIVTRDTGGETGDETGRSAAEAATPRVPVEQPAREPEPSASEAEARRSQAEPGRVDTGPPQSDADGIERAGPDNAEALMPAAQEAEARIFCMQMENSGRCRCYDAETMAPADVSSEACREQLAEE